MLNAGTMVGGYRVEHVLGEGGMGTVYAAVEPTIGKRVAIKVLRSALAADEATKARFEREARAVNAVRHPAVVEVFAFGQLDDGSPYFVMSLLEGRSLREELDAKTRLAPIEAWRILREVADALSAAHARGIAHRDLKPDNVFLEAFGERPSRPRVLDFGVAKVLDLGAGLGDGPDEAPLAKLTGTGTPIGTPAYMAPEQWWGQATSGQTDQYAFGVMLFEILTGGLPFRSKQYAELLQLHINTPAPHLSERGFTATPRQEAFIARLLAKAPADRFSDFAEVIAEGDATLAGGGEHEVKRADGLGSSERAKVETAPTAAMPGGLPTPAKTAATGQTESRLGADAPKATVPPPSGRYMGALAAIVAAGLGSIYALGYAGEAPRDVVLWLKNSGFAIFAVLAAFPISLFFLARAARARLVDTSPRYAPFFVALLPIVPSAVSTYTGWGMVLVAVGASGSSSRGFEILNEGMFEASTARFLGFALTGILLLAVSALFGEAPSRVTDTSLSVDKIERRWSAAAALALGASAIALASSSAPSAAFVVGTAALAEVIAFARPTTHPDSAHRDARDRALASGAAVVLALGVALARVEAREAALWTTTSTRALRIAEIVDAARERTLTLYAFFAAGVVLVVVEVLRVRRLRGRERPLPMPTSGFVLALCIVATGSLDIAFHQRFFAERGRLVESLREQFALFAKLDPPTSDSPALHEPSVAPALQITSETIAVNGRRIAKLGALDSPTGKSNVGHDLTNSLASEGATTDLSLLVDRGVPWGRVSSLLSLACEAGARRAEVLFTRGSAPTIPAHAPPEAGELLARDFGALDVELGDAGMTADEAQPFASVSKQMLDASSGRAGPLRLNLGCSRGGK